MKDRPLVIGVAAAVITVAIGFGLVLAVTSGDDDASGSAGTDAPKSEQSSTSTRRSTTTTSKPTGASSTVPATAPNAATTPPTDPPDPPDPADRYTPVPLPPGISATIASCAWSPAGGGQLTASGTVTNFGADDDVWFVNVYWLVRNQTQDEDIDSQAELYDLAVGQSLPWNLSISAPTAPPNLSCALEVD